VRRVARALSGLILAGLRTDRTRELYEPGQWEWGNTFPINWIPNEPEDANFNNLENRIDFGNKRCCEE